MTLILIIFSQLCLIFAVWQLAKAEGDREFQAMVLKKKLWQEIENMATHWQEKVDRYGKKASDKLEGKANQVVFHAKLAEKMADRAFNMASSANVGIAILQKALATPRLMTKQQGLQNEVAKNGVDKLFSRGGSFDYLRPILSDEENDLLDQAEELHRQQTMNGHKE